ncbi:hypothetical protein, partial [Enterococcus lemanii]|uniref:hypothetical protein n=1 Tax=Enterococcus lemanii TaxID=1159752 RepID=UPI00195B9AE1
MSSKEKFLRRMAKNRQTPPLVLKTIFFYREKVILLVGIQPHLLNIPHYFPKTVLKNMRGRKFNLNISCVMNKSSGH